METDYLFIFLALITSVFTIIFVVKFFSKSKMLEGIIVSFLIVFLYLSTEIFFSLFIDNKDISYLLEFLTFQKVTGDWFDRYRLLTIYIFLVFGITSSVMFFLKKREEKHNKQVR